MTTLNSERFVAEAISSVLKQTLRDLELVIVDGGSTDNTLQIIRQFRDRRIRLFVRDGFRRSAQLNYGVKKSGGDLIAILDSDDVAMPDRLERQVEYLHDHPEISVVGTAAYLMGEDGAILSVLRKPEKHETIARHILAMNAPSFPTICWRKAIFTHADFNVEIGARHDVEWYVRLLPHVRFANIPIPLTKLRQTTHSMSRPFRRVDDVPLVSSVERFVELRMREPLSAGERAELFRLAGIAHYYYGSLRKARQFLWNALRLYPLDTFTIRFLAPLVLLPLFSYVRETRTLKMLGRFYRNVMAR